MRCSTKSPLSLRYRKMSPVRGVISSAGRSRTESSDEVNNGHMLVPVGWISTVCPSCSRGISFWYSFWDFSSLVMPALLPAVLCESVFAFFISIVEIAGKDKLCGIAFSVLACAAGCGLSGMCPGRFGR